MNFKSARAPKARICVTVGGVRGVTINVRPFLIYRSAESVGLVVNFNAWLFPLTRPPVCLHHALLTLARIPQPTRFHLYEFSRFPHRHRKLPVRLPGSNAYITSVVRDLYHAFGGFLARVISKSARSFISCNRSVRILL